jgi:glycosyltransferase involved in cell wall biosynthesis
MHPAQLKDFYFSQDVILIPSRFDTVPMILIEALMCGKPVIISQKAGGKTSYKNLDLDEFIISPRIGGKHLYKIIQKLIASKNTYLPRYKKLQQKIIKDHNPEKVFEQYYKIFRSITK